MRNRTVAVAVAVSLSLGFTLAYAKKPVRKSKVKAAGLVKPGVFLQPRPAGMPTGPQVAARVRAGYQALGYEGFKVTPAPAAKGAELAAQSDVAAALGKLDFVPDHRRGHFAEMLSLPHVRHRGWLGRVESVSPAPGGVTAIVKVYPWIDHAQYGKPLITGRHVVETYFYDGENLRHLGSVAGVSESPGLIMP